MKPNNQQKEWASFTVDQQFKVEQHLTEFERELLRLGLTEDNCHENAELVAWVKSHRDTRYVPEKLLARLRVRTIYDEGNTAPFSLVEGTVIPEPSPLQEVEDANEETKQAA